MAEPASRCVQAERTDGFAALVAEVDALVDAPIPTPARASTPAYARSVECFVAGELATRGDSHGEVLLFYTACCPLPAAPLPGAPLPAVPLPYVPLPAAHCLQPTARCPTACCTTCCPGPRARCA
jgi:hypothetical protein